MAHFTNKKNVLNIATLDLIKLQKKYSNENQIALILKIFNDFEIRNKLGYMIIDNTYINDIFIDVIVVFLKDERIIYNTHKRRHRYNNYIINLIIQNFLFNQVVNNYEYFENKFIFSFNV